MPRTKISKQRKTETKKQNLGKVLLLCEGKSEKHYFDYFADIINKNGNKYDNIIVETQSANGNAQTVLNYSLAFLEKEENNRIYSNYEKYLVFDCDEPPNIASVIISASKQNFNLLVSNPFFETWLLMHFENVNNKLSKKETLIKLSSHLSHEYKKGQKGQTREILQTDNIVKAINNAQMIDKKYMADGKTIIDSIDIMNPYSNVYMLVEQLLLLIS